MGSKKTPEIIKNREVRKYNYTMKPGRFRTVCPEPDELIKLGEEMVTWVKENRPIHLSMWYSMEKNISDKVWDVMTQKEEFLLYYTQAIKLVGYNYIDKDSQVETRIKDRWQRVYFKDLRLQENSDLKDKNDREADLKKQLIEFDYKMKHEVLENVSEEVKQQYLALMNQLTALQNVKKIGS